MALQFAITGSGGYGVLQSIENQQSADISHAKGTDGKTVASKAFSLTKNVKADGLFNGDVLAGAGKSMTIDEVTGLVKNQTKSQSNTDWQKVSVEVELQDAATLTEYSA